MKINKAFIIILALLVSSTLYSQKKVYTVTNVNELYNAIGPDRIIELEQRTYYLSEITVEKENPYVYFNKEFDGNELVITDVKNLTIKGTGRKASTLITQPVYGDVLVFENCKNIELENIEGGHGPELGGCTGGVFHFINSNNISIKGCIMYGSGTEGITAENVNNLNCEGSIIKNCTYSIMSLSNCNNISFNDCDFKNNREFDLISISSSKNIKFDECEIYNNSTGVETYSEYCIFNLNDCASILVKDCEIRNNTSCFLATETPELKISGTELINNKFVKGKYKQNVYRNK